MVSNAQCSGVHSLCGRSMLCDSVKTLTGMIQRRFAADAQLLGNEKKKWFIDMRKLDELPDHQGLLQAVKNHKKKLSTYMMFNKELKKLQDQTRCPWSGVKRVPDTMVFVLVENVPGKKAKEASQGKEAKVCRCIEL